MPRWVDAREDDADRAEEESSSEEEEDEEQMDQDVEPDEGVAEDEEQGSGEDGYERAQSGSKAGPSGQKRKLTIPLGKKDLVCHVSVSPTIVHNSHF